MEPLDHEIAKALADTTPERGPARILVVADETVTAQLLSMLGKGRHMCGDARRLNAARKELTRRPYDLLLVDPQLPDGDDNELARLVRDIAPTTRTIVVSRTNTFETVIMAMRCGASDFVQLPVDAAELLSRIDSARIAKRKAEDAAQEAGRSVAETIGSVAASDAFFPFADGLLVTAEAGATAVIQPGGSIRDDEVIAAADNAGLAMVFTGMRHFRH